MNKELLRELIKLADRFEKIKHLDQETIKHLFQVSDAEFEAAIASLPKADN